MEQGFLKEFQLGRQQPRKFRDGIVRIADQVLPSGKMAHDRNLLMFSSKKRLRILSKEDQATR